MEWHIFPHEDGSGDWIVQAINFAGDGQLYTTIFSDSNAERRAQEFLGWQSRPSERIAA